MAGRRPIVATLLTGLVVGAPALAQVSGTRTLPPVCVAGEPIAVGLDLQVGAVVPNGVIVVETLPAGWALQTATPPQTNFNPVTREIRWVFFGAAVNDDGMDIGYTAIAGEAEPSFAGSLLFNDAAGEPATVGIAGADACAAAAVCSGDCNGDGTVTIDEVLRQVGILLGDVLVANCPAADADGSGTVTVDELVTAVNNALGGCTPR